MPRPGPRPYECIRRAWHSDSHQPLRGALIQEIFRVVNELHSTSTRRKKEWQEKLPIVVLRAEEILYSKANSESEYAGVETLRTRLDDAVNTMIRRDDSEEEGLYLPPCVEAALSLGCTPKKIPRRQRQVASRLLPSGARSNPTVCASSNGSFRGMPGKGKIEAKCASDQSTNSSPGMLGAQVSQIQDQGFSTALPMGNPSLYSIGGPPSGGPIACFAHSPGFILSQNIALPTPFEASHPILGPSLPQLGGLVQFLTSADPNVQAGHVGSVPFSMQINDSQALPYAASRGSRAQMGAQFVSTDVSASVRTASISSSPGSSLSRSTPETSREHDRLVKNSLTGLVPMSMDIPLSKDLMSVDARMTPQMHETPASRPDIFLKNTQTMAEPDISCTKTQTRGFSIQQSRWQTCPVPKFRTLSLPPSSYKPTPLQRSSTESQLLIDAGDHTCVDDLQLRLGPPGKEPTTTSALTGDPSASKRSRTDLGKLDDSGSINNQLHLCTLPLSEQLSWSRF